MDPTHRFAQLIGRPAHLVPLDEVALLIAAHAYPSLDVKPHLSMLDRLADSCRKPTLEALLERLFVDLGFTGNCRDYNDPRNSYLNDVLDRHVGIPISLAVLAMEVGRRLGVPLVGVGMPGHFLLRDTLDDGVYVDPFAGGRVLDRAGCEEAFHQVHGERVPFKDGYLDPVDAHAIVARMLANLRATFTARGDRTSLAWTLRLRTLVPGTPAEERAELASVLASRGQFGAAAGEFDTLAAQLGGELGVEYHRSATRLRARLN